MPPIDVEIGGFEFRGVSLPSGDVGGDLVDVVDHANDAAWTAYVTDVSGHGVPSGVLMGMIKSAMRMALVAPVPLEALLDRLNDVLFELKPPQMYATFAALRRDGRDELSFTLAGHLPILHWRADSGDGRGAERRTGAAGRAPGPDVRGQSRAPARRATSCCSSPTA